MLCSLSPCSFSSWMDVPDLPFIRSFCADFKSTSLLIQTQSRRFQRPVLHAGHTAFRNAPTTLAPAPHDAADPLRHRHGQPGLARAREAPQAPQLPVELQAQGRSPAAGLGRARPRQVHPGDVRQAAHAVSQVEREVQIVSCVNTTLRVMILIWLISLPQRH